MLNQQAFEDRHSEDWARLDAALTAIEKARPWKKAQRELTADLPMLYAALCQQHALAVSRGYSHSLTKRLHALSVRAHHQLYKYRGNVLYRCMRFLGGGFSYALRQQWRLFSLSCVLFFFTAIIVGSISAYSTDFATLVLGGEQRHALENMYEPSDEPLRPEGLEDESNLYMFGFYIMNNIGIDFRVFATGILFGIGSVFFTVYNGIVIGAAAGHLTGIGYNDTFWGFVSGHSAPELIALCISCTAGLMLGAALIKPGQQTRRLALTRAAHKAVPLIVGAGLMTLLAAFIEAYWSSRTYPLQLKLLVGGAIWILFILYLGFAGRNMQPGATSR